MKKTGPNTIAAPKQNKRKQQNKIKEEGETDEPKQKKIKIEEPSGSAATAKSPKKKNAKQKTKKGNKQANIAQMKMKGKVKMEEESNEDNKDGVKIKTEEICESSIAGPSGYDYSKAKAEGGSQHQSKKNNWARQHGDTFVKIKKESVDDDDNLMKVKIEDAW